MCCVQPILNMEDLKRKMLNIVTCPISNLIFDDPVVSKYGKTFERTEIERWLEIRKVCPLTNEQMEIHDLFENIDMRSVVTLFLELYPDETKNQYKHDNNYNGNTTRILQYIKNKNFDKLLNYIQFNILHMITEKYNGYSIFGYFLKHCSNSNIIKHVFDNCVNMDLYREDDGIRAVHIVSSTSNPTILQYVINDDNLYILDNFGLSPLHCAIEHMIIPNIEYLLTLVDITNPIYNDIMVHNNIGKLPDNIVINMINKGANLKCINESQQNPLHTACFSRKTDIIMAILEKQTISINDRDNKSSTVLHIACNLLSEEIVFKILQIEGVDIDVYDEAGYLPLHIACLKNKLSIVKELLAKYPDAINTKVINNGATLLQMALESDNIEMVKFLLDNKCDLEATNNYNLKPIHFSCYKSSYEILNLLLPKGLDLNEKDFRGYVPGDYIKHNSKLSSDDKKKYQMRLIK